MIKKSTYNDSEIRIQKVEIGEQGLIGAIGLLGLKGYNEYNGYNGYTGSYPVHYIGESYGGGKVFYVYDDGQHGLIAATTDQYAGVGIQWYNGTYRYTGTTSDGVHAGTMDTAIIIATQMADTTGGNFAAKVCADYSVTVGGITYGDWYLPSRYELNLLYEQKDVVGDFANYYYWSSSEASKLEAWHQFFANGAQEADPKNYEFQVRAVRAF
jgi:hypothetical protein